MHPSHDQFHHPLAGGPGGRWARRGPRHFEDDFPGPGRPGPHHDHGHIHGPGGVPPWMAGRRARRGDIRWALLIGLLDGPAHGYELIGRLEARSGGMWRPSAGSVYPTLQLLEDEGLIIGRESEGKRVFELTEAGRGEATEANERLAARTAAGGDGPGGHHGDLRQAVKTLMLAARQVAAAGDDTQVEAAVAVITDARQRLYRLLAGDPLAEPEA